MAEYQYLKIAIAHRVAVVTIDRPPVNALNQNVLEEISTAVDELSANPDVKALVLTGAGQQVFVAGADLNVFAEIKAMTDIEQMQSLADEYLQLGHRTFNKLAAMPIPTICAINGAALGGGLELALACDMRFAADNARLGFPEINLGIIPGWGGTQRLPRLIGASRAYELILTGDTFPAPQALQMGLVNKVVPAAQLLREAQGMARKLTEKSRMALNAAFQAINQGLELPMAEGLVLERKQLENLLTSEDMKEGIDAFLQKRRPEFKDR